MCVFSFSLTLQNHQMWKTDWLSMSKGHAKEARAWLDRVVTCLPVYTCCAEHPLTCTAGTDRQSHDNPAWVTTSLTATPTATARGRGWGPGGLICELILNAVYDDDISYFDSNIKIHQKQSEWCLLKIIKPISENVPVLSIILCSNCCQ